MISNLPFKRKTRRARPGEPMLVGDAGPRRRRKRRLTDPRDKPSHWDKIILGFVILLIGALYFAMTVHEDQTSNVAPVSPEEVTFTPRN